MGRSRGRKRTKEITNTNYCPQLLQEFEKLCNSLSPPETYLQRGTQIAREIFEVLKKNLKLKLICIKIAGSVGKSTGISFRNAETNSIKNPDFDLVIFVDADNIKPPFKGILDAFREVIQGIPNVENVKQTRISVQFTYKCMFQGEIHFDLLPARNHVRNRDTVTGDVGRLEAKNAIEDLKQSGKINAAMNKLYSSSLCEQTVSLIRKRVAHPFNLKVVRLAKYWTSHLKLGVYVAAKSYITELIAVHSQKEKRKRCIVSGFRRFLETMASFDTLIVEIGKKEGEEQAKLYTELIGKTRHKPTPPIIIDPANPYNNLAHRIEPIAVLIIVEQAKKTMEVLESFRSQDKFNSVENVIEKIFSHKRD